MAQARTWLRKQGFVVGAVPKDRLFVSASGSASRVEQAFGVSLGYYQVNGRTVRLAHGALSIPASLAGVVSGVVGVNEYLATTDLARESHDQVSRIAKPKQEPAPPPASATRSPARRTSGRRSTPRTPPRCTRPTPLRCRTTSADTCRASSAVRTDCPALSPRATTAMVSRSPSSTPTIHRRCCPTPSSTSG